MTGPMEVCVIDISRHLRHLRVQVVISAVEPGSPASDNADIVVGLRLASVNGAALPDGGSHVLKKAWRGLLREPRITLEYVSHIRVSLYSKSYQVL